MFMPSPEMMAALAEIAFIELASLPEAEILRLLNGILEVVNAGLTSQGYTRPGLTMAVETALIKHRDQWSASLNRKDTHSNLNQ